MKSEFGSRMAALRQDKGISQRRAAAELKISQALLSHYETGAREPKFEFIKTACDYYEVTADYLLGHTNEQKSGAEMLSNKIREIITSLEELKVKETELINALTEMVGNNDI